MCMYSSSVLSFPFVLLPAFIFYLLPFLLPSSVVPQVYPFQAFLNGVEVLPTLGKGRLRHVRQRFKESKRLKDKRREQEQMGRWKDREKDRERPRVEEVLHATL